MAAESGPPPGAGRTYEGDEALRAYLAAARPDLDASPALGTALRAALEAARAAWPGVELSAETFVRFVATKLPQGAPAEGALAELCVGDLYLAYACALGDPRAIARLEQLCASVVDRAVARLGASDEQVGEVRQRVRHRLLAPRGPAEGGPPSPRIAEFSGRGALGAWLRVVAVREAVGLFREQRRRPVEDEALANELEPDAGPELAYFRRLYRDEFKAAFAAAVEVLSERDRTLLRQHALDGLSIDRLAALYQVHRATAARWVESARRAVLEHTRQALTQRLHLRPDELDSVMRFLDGQLDVSLPPLLRARG